MAFATGREIRRDNIVDDCHAVGFVGGHGPGSAEHCGVEARGDILTGTLGKALGGAWGGYTVKINGTSANPDRWPDGTYSVQGAAAALGVTRQTVWNRGETERLEAMVAQGLLDRRVS